MRVFVILGLILIQLQSRAQTQLGPAQLLDLAREKAGDSPQESLKILDQVEELQKKNFILPVALEASLIRCDYFLDNDDPREALNISAKWLERKSELSVEQISKVQLCRANALSKKGDALAAEQEYTQLLLAARAANAKEQEGDVLFDFGKFHSYQSNYARALEDLQAAQRIFTELKEDNKIRITFNSIAILYGRIGEDKKSIEYFQEVLKQNRQLGKKRNEAVVLYNMGRRYEAMKDFASALESYQASLKIHQELKNTTSEAVLEKALGGLYNLKNQPQKALVYLKKSLQVFEQKGVVKSMSQVHLEMAIAYRALKQHTLATQELKKAEAYFGARASLTQKRDLAEQQNLLFKDQGLWQDAYKKFAEYKEYSDDIGEKQKGEQLLRQQLNFETNALRKENELKEQRLQDSNRIRSLQLVIMFLGALLGFASCVFLIRQVKLARRMKVLAHTDELTKIANRRHVIAYGEELLAQCKEQNLPFSVLLLDIDFFKKVNDNFGHAIGDIVLSKTAQVCASALRKGDCIGRFGGEEFLVVLPGSTPEQAAEVAERICTKVAITNLSDIHPDLRITISVGAASDLLAHASLDELTAKADEALYHVKHNGRNGVKVVSVA
jgi:diguanylate cyclase (GGDEF)-like protein